MASKALQYLVVLFLIFSIAQSSYLLYKVDQMEPIHPEYKGTAAASGYVQMCINAPPVLGIPCNDTWDQGNFYACQLNATDSSNSGLVFNGTFIGNRSLFNVTRTGYMSFNPIDSDVGNYTINFTVVDNSTCPNNLTSQLFNLSIQNINDPPYLSQTIPNITFGEEEQVRAFYLNNHFTDPDDDPMTYTVSGAEEADIRIAVTSEVIITSDDCEFEDVVIFTAWDPFNASGISNSVVITCMEDDAQLIGDGGSGAGGAGGSGGSGGLCKSDWRCSTYIPCNESNILLKKCVDANGCDADEEFIAVDCDFIEEQRKICKEQWLCSDWSECYANSTQIRSCLDLDNCGTYYDKPETSQICSYIPTCFDGKKNGNETGIDCGGNCPICKSIESPMPIEDHKGIITTALMLLVLMLLLSILAYRYAHKQIYQVLALMGLHFSGRVAKQALLNDEQRDYLLEGIKNLEDNLETIPVHELTSSLIQLTKAYFFQVLGLEIDSDKEDLLAKCEERKANEHLIRVLASFFDKSQFIEFSGNELSGYELMYILNELKELVLETSNYDFDLLEREITEYQIPENFYPLEKAHLMMVNTYIALHFNELQAATEKYMELISYYETLSVPEKDTIYEDIARVYQKIRYRAAWIENM
ncbi:hypothetical protein ACFL1B_04265 [Nanoarchaeota archaeon]